MLKSFRTWRYNRKATLMSSRLVESVAFLDRELMRSPMTRQQRKELFRTVVNGSVSFAQIVEKLIAAVQART